LKKIKALKGQILQKNGELNTKVYHVKSGLLRSYFMDKNGKEHIFMFAPEGWVIADYTSPNEPSTLFIDVLEDASIIVIEKNIKKETDGERLINRMSVLQKRVIQLMSSSAIKRYEDFIATYPDISQRVPQRMIASYLGITPEALSKVKGERKNRIIENQ